MLVHAPSPTLMTSFRSVALLLLLCGCAQKLKLATSDAPSVLARQTLQAPNPSEKGSFQVKTLYYGSGTDKNRREFRDSVTIKTKTVDGSKFADAPNAAQRKIRRDYWGFGFDKLPVNGRVWYPEGPGPFPLVLVVHGNHNMKDFSDPGYGYLGELMASRGFIFASVDENFLNGFMNAENDGRGWMLLKHLEAWRAFNDSAGGPFHRKVDLGRVGLIGHSRGGEAVAVAAAFNRLSHYPDDATQKFDFNFGIRSLIAIAPIDGQYEPAQRPTPLENVSYLVIHGSHDGDVSAFSGLRQYQRIQFTDDGPWFKSAVWMYRANHGQWNTVWGNQDNGPTSARFLDLRGLVTPEEQQQFGRVYMSAFLEATLRDDTRYLPMFRDHREIGPWLPKTMYATRFQDSRFKVIADFQEDVNVATGSVRGVRISSDSLASWKEGALPLRWRNSFTGTNAVWVGWNNRIAGDDTTKMGRPASYSIALTDSVRAAWNVSERSSLQFSLAPTDVKPAPRRAPVDTAKKADSTKKAAPKPKPPKPPKNPPKDSTPVQLSVVAVDLDGDTARVSLASYGVARRPLEIQVMRRAVRERQRFGNQYELLLQTYVIPLADFTRAQPRFDAARLASVRFVFDRTIAGTVIIDDIGFSSMNPAFYSAAGQP